MLSKAIDSPEFRKQAARYGLALRPIVGDEFGEIAQRDTEFWKTIIKHANLKKD